MPLTLVPFSTIHFQLYRLEQQLSHVNDCLARSLQEAGHDRTSLKKQRSALEDELEVIAEASNGADAVKLAVELDPDLIILDLNMQGMDGIATLKKMRDEGVTSRIVMLTVSDADEDIVKAISNGADGYLLKDTDPEVLLDQIKKALEGKMVLSEAITQVLATASRGVYAIDRVSGLDPAIKKRYFQRGSGPNEGQCRVHPALRELIDFRPLNLLAPRYDVGGPFDALFCRNVMIYFDKPTQYGILKRYVPLLRPDGLLFAGHSESFSHAVDLFRNLGRTVYARADGGR